MEAGSGKNAVPERYFQGQPLSERRENLIFAAVHGFTGRLNLQGVKNILQNALKFLLPLLFGCGIFLFLYKDTDVDAVAAVLQRGISWNWVLISLLFALFSHVLRGVRWRLQLRMFGADPSTHDMSVSIFGNYGLNLLFPRLGEVWRCNYIAHNYRVPFSTTVGSMISERVVDLVCSVSIALLAFALQSHVFFRFFETHTIDGGPWLSGRLLSPWLIVGGAAVIVLAVVFRRRLRATRFYGTVKEILHKMWIGFASLRQLPDRRRYLLYSVAIWLLYFLNSYTCIFFFDFTSHLGILAALSIFVMGSLSLVVPVQGGLGAWHAAVVFALGCYGLPETEALSFALVSWTIEQGFVLLLGIYALIFVLFKRHKNI